MIPSPLRIETLSRAKMIEIIMTIAGRDIAEPRKFRAWLEGFEPRGFSAALSDYDGVKYD